MFINSTKSYMCEDLGRLIFFPSCCFTPLVATLSYYRFPSRQLFPGQRAVMAATMGTSAGTNMLQFLKLIGQLKVRNLNSLCWKRK